MRKRKRERNIVLHHKSFIAYGVRSFGVLLHGENAAGHPGLKGDSEFLSHFLERNLLRIFSLPRRVVLMHIVGESSAGIIFRYLSKFSETIPRLPITTGTTRHSVSHMRPSSRRSPLYLVIFSCSFSETLMSLGQDISII